MPFGEFVLKKLGVTTGMPFDQEELSQFAWAAFDHPWPTRSYGGVRGKLAEGFDGARAARVLATVIKLVAQRQAWCIAIGLEDLGTYAGIVKWSSLRDALSDLHDAGWLNFEIGEQDSYKGGVFEPGRPSFITLLPRKSEGSFLPSWLPEPTLDAFRSNIGGSAGYLIAARLVFRFETDPDLSTGRTFSVSVSEVADLTGLKYARVKSVLPKMEEYLGYWEENGRYTFPVPLIYGYGHNLSVAQLMPHLDLFQKKRAKRGHLKEHPATVLWEWDQQHEKLVEVYPIDQFPSGNPIWSESHRERGDVFVQTHEDRLKKRVGSPVPSAYGATLAAPQVPTKSIPHPVDEQRLQEQLESLARKLYA